MKSGASALILVALLAFPANSAFLRSSPAEPTKLVVEDPKKEAAKKDDKKEGGEAKKGEEAKDEKPKGPCEALKVITAKYDKLAQKDPASKEVMKQHLKKLQADHECDAEKAKKAKEEADKKMKESNHIDGTKIQKEKDFITNGTAADDTAKKVEAQEEAVNNAGSGKGGKGGKGGAEKKDGEKKAKKLFLAEEKPKEEKKAEKKEEKGDAKADDKKAEEPKGPCDKVKALEKQVKKIAAKNPASGKLMDKHLEKLRQDHKCDQEKAAAAAKKAEEEFDKKGNHVDATKVQEDKDFIKNGTAAEDTNKAVEQQEDAVNNAGTGKGKGAGKGDKKGEKKEEKKKKEFLIAVDKPKKAAKKAAKNAKKDAEDKKKKEEAAKGPCGKIGVLDKEIEKIAKTDPASGKLLDKHFEKLKQDKECDQEKAKAATEKAEKDFKENNHIDGTKVQKEKDFVTDGKAHEETAKAVETQEKAVNNAGSAKKGGDKKDAGKKAEKKEEKKK